MTFAPIQIIGWFAVMLFIVAAGPRGNGVALLLIVAAIIGLIAISVWQQRHTR